MGDSIIFPDQTTMPLPPATVAAIRAASAHYATPLWSNRAERVLKLGGHQWISPPSPTVATLLWAAQPSGLVATAWKLFNRDWRTAAADYFSDSLRYPYHPRHWGQPVIPLVDEDNAGQQIGWVAINQQTQADENYALFVQFTLLEMFAPRALPAEYV